MQKSLSLILLLFFSFTVHAEYKLVFNPINYKSVEVSATSTGVDKFRNELPLFAVDNGIVGYVGELKDYGQVILVDHGDGRRSVYLGNLEFNQNKGDNVKAGQVIGFTKIDSNKSDKFFFQQRVNNNPIKFMFSH